MDTLAGLLSYVSGQATYEENARSARLRAEIASLRERLDAQMPFVVNTTGAGGVQCHFAFSDAGSSAPDSELEYSATASDFQDDSYQLATLPSSSVSITTCSSSGVDSEASLSIVLSDDHAQSVQYTSTVMEPSLTRLLTKSSLIVKRITRPARPVIADLLSLSQDDLGIVRRLFDSRWTPVFDRILRMPLEYAPKALSPDDSVLVAVPNTRAHRRKSVSGVVVDLSSAHDGPAPTTSLQFAPRAFINNIRDQDQENADDEDFQLPGAWPVDEQLPSSPRVFLALVICLVSLLVALWISKSNLHPPAHLASFVMHNFKATRHR